MDPVITPLLVGGAIAGGQAYLGHRQNLRNQEFQTNLNAENRQHQWNMYWQQREHALSDWNAMNQYNSPSQQMQRLREAGLNPNLVYGKGAENTAVMTRASQSSQLNNQAPRWDNSIASHALGSIVGQINQIHQGKQIQAQTDNLHANTALTAKEALLKEALTAKTMSETASNKFQLKQSEALYADVLQAAKLQNALTNAQIGNTLVNTEKQGSEIGLIRTQKANVAANTTMTLDENERRALANTANVAKTYQDILESKQRVAQSEEQINLIRAQVANLKEITKNQQQQNRLNQFSEKLNEYGITASDPWYVKILGSFIAMLAGKVEDPTLTW